MTSRDQNQFPEHSFFIRDFSLPQVARSCGRNYGSDFFFFFQNSTGCLCVCLCRSPFGLPRCPHVLSKSPISAPFLREHVHLDGQTGSPAGGHTCDGRWAESRGPVNRLPLFVTEKAQTFSVLLFKRQQCKGHRGRDETRSCNKEGEIKNNDRNKLS